MRGSSAGRAAPVLAHDVAGEGPLVVLLHGIAENRRSWDPLVAPLARRARVLRVDLRGHGESPAAGPYTMDGLAAEVRAVVDAVADPGEQPPLVVGHGVGGFVGSVYGAHHPARGVLSIEQPMDLMGLRSAIRNLEPYLRSTAFADVFGQLFGSRSGKLPPDEFMRLETIRRPRQAVVLAMWALAFEHPGERLDAEVRRLVAAPGLTYLSLHGTTPPPGYVEALRALIPRAEVEVWEDGGHYPHLVQQQRFVERVQEFDATLRD